MNTLNQSASISDPGLRTSDFGPRASAVGLRAAGPRHRLCAFTLVEVMIASGIFFMATFAILALVASTLRNARGLEKTGVDIGIVASQVYETLKTNKFSEGSYSGDLGSSYPDYFYDVEWGPYDTNGLLEADIVLNRHGSQNPSILSPSSSFPPTSKPAPAAGPLAASRDEILPSSQYPFARSQ